MSRLSGGGAFALVFGLRASVSDTSRNLSYGGLMDQSTPVTQPCSEVISPGVLCGGVWVSMPTVVGSPQGSGKCETCGSTRRTPNVPTVSHVVDAADLR